MRTWVRRYEGESSLDDRPRSGARRRTTAAQDAEIVAAHTRDPFRSTGESAAQNNVSMRTVQRRLHEVGLHCRRPARKLLMTESHKRNRISFCNQYLNFDWENNVVIFLDEKSFKSNKDGRKILWRRNNERYSSINILPNRASGRITLNYVGWMSSMGPGELCQVSGRMNAEQYIEILRDVVFPSVRICYPDEHIYFIQDNCSIHRAAIVRDWMATLQNVTVIEWPAKSPDLNPIENLWGFMTLAWDPSQDRNSENLNDIAMDTWESMRGRDHCWNMVMDMRSRLEEVLACGGGPIRF